MTDIAQQLSDRVPAIAGMREFRGHNPEFPGRNSGYVPEFAFLAHREGRRCDDFR